MTSSQKIDTTIRMNDKKYIVIAVDGPAASGKGTLARSLARHFNLAYFDTGLLYRGVGYRVYSQGLDSDNEADVLEATDWLINNFDEAMSDEANLRGDIGGAYASKVAYHQKMRDKLVQLQKDFAANPASLGGFGDVQGAVLDGRDIGTVICPDADAKLFITADVEKRTERRVKELQNNGLSVTYTDILAQMRERDNRDASRKSAPMRTADDAKVIDTTAMNPDEVLEEAMKFVKDRTGIA